jgi:hypothetical protein
MFKHLKKLLSGPNALEAATAELEEAYLALLSAQTGVDYAKSMVAYNEARIIRLEAYLGFVEEPK